jgi:hypothetical protein
VQAATTLPPREETVLTTVFAAGLVDLVGFGCAEEVLVGPGEGLVLD